VYSISALNKIGTRQLCFDIMAFLEQEQAKDTSEEMTGFESK
jgi:hypothetical protein